MAMVRYGVSRNMPCEDKAGNDLLMCLCLIQHENGETQRHVIAEDAIKWACGDDLDKQARYIEMEVQEAALKGGILVGDKR